MRDPGAEGMAVVAATVRPLAEFWEGYLLVLTALLWALGLPSHFPGGVGRTKRQHMVTAKNVLTVNKY